MQGPTAEDRGGPTPLAERIHALDALRGVALLGILWANVRQLLQPWDIGNLPLAIGSNEWLAWLERFGIMSPRAVILNEGRVTNVRKLSAKSGRSKRPPIPRMVA